MPTVSTKLRAMHVLASKLLLAGAIYRSSGELGVDRRDDPESKPAYPRWLDVAAAAPRTGVHRSAADLQRPNGVAFAVRNVDSGRHWAVSHETLLRRYRVCWC